MLAPADTLNGVSRTDGVLLDLYNTIGWVPEVVLARQRLADRAGVDAEALTRAWAGTLQARSIGAFPSLEAEIDAILRECGSDPSPELLRELATLENEIWRGAVRLFDDTRPFVRRQRELGRRVAIVSNCSRQTRAAVVEHGLEREVDAVVLSCELGVAKPDPGIFEAALAAIDVAPERAVFVDDVPEYLDGARALGIRTLCIARDGASGEHDGGHLCVRDLAEVERLLA
jgi:putative hydrolase of the HAD superfamily